MQGYENTAETLRDRIVALIPANPAILDMKDVFELFRVTGFECRDLNPSLAQAAVALRAAQELYELGNHE